MPKRTISVRKWYQKKRWILTSLLLLPPLGLPLLWITRWPRPIKLTGSLLGLLLLSSYASKLSSPTYLTPVLSSSDVTTQQSHPVVEPAPLVSAQLDATNLPASAPLTSAPIEYDITPEFQKFESVIPELTVDNPCEEADTSNDRLHCIRVDNFGDPTIEPEWIEYHGTYISGSCQSLRERGVGSNFVPGEANYTASRDRDGDGIACES